MQCFIPDLRLRCAEPDQPDDEDDTDAIKDAEDVEDEDCAVRELAHRCAGWAASSAGRAPRCRKAL